MKAGTDIATPVAAAELTGDAHPLLEQLGSAEGIALAGGDTSAAQFFSGRIQDEASLQQFLEAYRTQLLLPLELPVIVAAHGHACRNELRELIALDQRLAADPSIKKFAAASYRVGQRQLSKLRALRDHRLIQRYLAAVEKGEAHGWHVLVYGISLAAYSLPVRQGLQHYAEHTMRGFIESGAKTLQLSQAAVNQSFSHHTIHIPAGIEAAIAAHSALKAV